MVAIVCTQLVITELTHQKDNDSSSSSGRRHENSASMIGLSLFLMSAIVNECNAVHYTAAAANSTGL